jgi:hypothetical protein
MKRLRLISIVVTVIALGGLAFAILRAREPRYDGRTLTEWIRKGAIGHGKFVRNPGADLARPKNETDWMAATNAIQHMASDAIPILLAWAQTDDSSLRQKAIDWLDEHPSFHLRINSAAHQRVAARIGFYLLGDAAKPAWPVLIQWTYSTNIDRLGSALDCLQSSHANKEVLLPVLLRLIHDPDTLVRASASLRFVDWFPQEAEAAGVYKIFPELRNSSTNQPNTNQASGR